MDKQQNQYLRSSIRFLGGLLGETIIAQEGQPVFDMVEEIRGLAKAGRSGDETALQQLSVNTPKLVADLPLAIANLKAFSTYFQLVNLAEVHERVRVLRKRAQAAFEQGEPMEETISAAIATLKGEGVSAEELQVALKGMVVTPVFTAHPTESKRRLIQQILGAISGLMKKLDSKDLFPYEREKVNQKLHDYIVLLWQSDETRNRRPTVMDEVRNTGLYFFESTLFDLVPLIYEEIESALALHYPDDDFDVPSFFTYGSWIGGDRDGNPYVTPEVTEDAIHAHQDAVVTYYVSEVRAMYQLLSPSISRTGFSSEFLASIEVDMQLAGEAELEVIERFSQEPYRKKLVLIYRRLLATAERNKQPWNANQAKDPRAYGEVGEFLEDLNLIRDSLMVNQGERLACGRFERLIRAVRVFGFHLATLDVRQHSRLHCEAAAEIFASNGLEQDFLSLAESEKVKLLTTEISDPRPWTGGEKALRRPFQPETMQVLELFRMIRQAQDIAGRSAIESYIISMTQGVSDLLEVMLFAEDAGLAGRLDIVPLFETVEDLRNAPDIMTELFANPVYREHLKQRGDRQQIMIGYSDSNKDGGYLQANWKLFTAQRNLAEVCNQHEITMTLFHGRGGSLGRGGGPSNRAILAQPHESVRGRIRITEQGEVVSSRYSDPEIAHRHLQQLLHAVICSIGERPVFPKMDQWSEVMEQVSDHAYKKYRELVQDSDFLEYFQTASPIDQIGQLNIGSRPSHRRKTQTLDDLRAIPWVFAWTQSRAAIPSWYGVGSGFEVWVGAGDRQQRTEMLKEMVRDWPFFRTLLANVHLGMGRADISIARLYGQLAGEKVGTAIFEKIQTEFELTRQWVLEITETEQLLDTEPWLQKSIQVRNPYVDPLNYIQVALLEEIRKHPESPDLELLQKAILQSINGIASGLQNVG